MSFIIRNRFSFLSRVCLLLAFLCLFLGFITIAFATITPLNKEAICIVGVSGMSPSVEIALINEGIYTPSPQIIAQIGKPLNYSSPWNDTDIVGYDWLWLTLRVKL